MSEDNTPTRIPIARLPQIGARLQRIPIGDEILQEAIFERPTTLIDSPPAIIETDEPVPFVSSEVTGSLDPIESARIRNIVLQDPRIKALHGNARIESIGKMFSAPKDQEANAQVKQIIYNYANNSVTEATVDIERGVVTAIEQLKYQPPPTENELRTAVSIASKDRRIADQVAREELEGSAILVTARPGDEAKAEDHRLFDVKFGQKDSRVPLLQAMVDLSTSEVISAGRIE